MQAQSPSDQPGQLDVRQVRHSFSRAAGDYENHAVLAREVHAELLARLDFYVETPTRVLDVGAGPGHDSAALKKRYPDADVLALDFALPMLAQARKHSRWRRRFAPLAGDAAQLPLADKSVDLVYSNLCLPWCADLRAVLREWVRVLRSGGYLALSSFGPDTLREVRQAWASVDEQPHVGYFPDMHDLGDTLFAAGFKEPVLDVSRYTLTYAEPMDALRELKALGATNADRERRRSLTGKRRFRAMLEALEATRTQGRIPLTFEVVTAHAWGPAWRWRER